MSALVRVLERLRPALSACAEHGVKSLSKDLLFEFIAVLPWSASGPSTRLAKRLKRVGQIQSRQNRLAGGEFEFQQVHHWPAPPSKRRLTPLIVDVPGVTRRAAQADQVRSAACRLWGRRAPGVREKADRQAIDVLGRRRLQACDGGRRRLGAGVGGVVAEAMQGRFVGMDGFRAWQKAEPFQIIAVASSGPARVNR